MAGCQAIGSAGSGHVLYSVLSRKCSLCTTLECPAHSVDEEPGHLQGLHHPSPVLCCLPCMGTLHLVQISRIFLVKLLAACEELVAWKRRSGKSAVIPRQKWQPHVTARPRCAAARCLRTNTEACLLPGQTDAGDASLGWYVVQGSSCFSAGAF